MLKVKPLLSCEVSLDKINFPVYVSTKFNGIRALVIDSVMYSRSLKPVVLFQVKSIAYLSEIKGLEVIYRLGLLRAENALHQDYRKGLVTGYFWEVLKRKQKPS